jgi:hypothetical protein
MPEQTQQSDGQGLAFVKPKNLMHAMSEVQQWYLGEKNGQPFDRSFFTMNHFMAFTEVALKSAFMDSVIWIFGYVLFGASVLFIQNNYLGEQSTQLFFWRISGSPLYWFARISSYAGFAFSTTLCVLMSRYFTGVVPRRAVNTLFSTRAIFLGSFALVSFLLLGLAYHFVRMKGLPETMYLQLRELTPLFAARLYQFVEFNLPRILFEAGITIILACAVSIVLPYITISCFRVAIRRREGLGIPQD